jgi:hypothetical protein
MAGTSSAYSRSSARRRPFRIPSALLRDWLPTTYYAKVGGRLLWSSGFDYLYVFALEYAGYLWCFLVAAVFTTRAGGPFVPVLFSSLVLPHALYIASIGGDHFEYRP